MSLYRNLQTLHADDNHSMAAVDASLHPSMAHEPWTHFTWRQGKSSGVE